jgi:hypothetical protein
MSNRGKRLQAEIGTFLKEYKRKAQRGKEPNDRSYDRDIETKIRSMAAEDVSKLIQGELSSEVPPELEDRWLAEEQVESVRFCVNDTVTITHGFYTGAVGKITALLRLKPEPEYLIELGSGEGEVKVFESRLNGSDT